MLVPQLAGISDIIGVREIIFIVLLIALIIFYVQYRKRQM